MQNIILFETEAVGHLLPLTATRPVAELRLGILTLRQKWEKMLDGEASFVTRDYLQKKFSIHIERDNLLVNSHILPTENLCRRIESLSINEAILDNDELIAARLSDVQLQNLFDESTLSQIEGIAQGDDITLTRIARPWDFLELNDSELKADFARITQGRKSAPISASNQVIAPENIFLEPGVKMEFCTLNASAGPIYIGENAEVMEGSMLRGSLSIGAGSVVKMGAKIYGPTTIGPQCRIGGEITRSILIGYSNKSHDGFLGDSLLGEWCNLGADTNNSNLKNNYSEVRLWDYETGRFERTGRQFFGLMMGDHSKCGINTMFNTGTVAGVFANIFGAGYQRNFIPDFSWGGPDSPYMTYKLKDAIATAEQVMGRRGITFTELDADILNTVFEHSTAWRSWEKK